MADKHLSTQFDSELNTVSGRVMAMGGHAEAVSYTHLTLPTKA